MNYICDQIASYDELDIRFIRAMRVEAMRSNRYCTERLLFLLFNQ
jgi:hypothetical protein